MEDMVRSEAVDLLRFLYTSECFEDEKMAQIYEVMIAVAIVDRNCSVKIKALKFWDEVIWKRLKNQGLIDGKFPEVTFSTESKKIVRLNDYEIKRRLNMVLNELNASGCLQVLIKSIKDDPNIEVVETAVEVTKKFIELLRKHEILQLKTNADYDDFFILLGQDLDKILENKKKLLRKSDVYLVLLLNNMLKELNQEEYETKCNEQG